MAARNTSAFDRSRRKAASGFALLQVNGVRRSSESDSGRTKMPYSALARHSPAATQNGRRRSTTPSMPPRAGPAMKPKANAAPIKPNPAARRSASVMSAT